jgi:hypothetical protein
MLNLVGGSKEIAKNGNVCDIEYRGNYKFPKKGEETGIPEIPNIEETKEALKGLEELTMY